MLPLLEGQRNDLTDIFSLGDVIEEFNSDITVFGEIHCKEHKEVIAANAKIFKKMGYNTAYIEANPIMQPFVDKIAKGNKTISTGSRDIDYLVSSLAAANIQILCADVVDIVISGISYRNYVLPKHMEKVHAYRDFTHQTGQALEDQILESKILSPDEFSKLEADFTLCYYIGEKSLQNFFSHINFNPIDNIFEKQAKAIQLSLDFEKERQEIYQIYGVIRNTQIAEKISGHHRRGQKALCSNGIGHINPYISKAIPQSNLQALLSQKHRIETLSIGIYGGRKSTFSKADHPNPLLDQDELRYVFSNNIHMARLSDPCFFNSELNDKLFYVDHYDANEALEHEDISLHLPALQPQ